MKLFCSTGSAGPCFEGWYFKHQNRNGQALALIPAYHIDSAGRRTVSLQVIAKDKAWWLEYPESQLCLCRQPFLLKLGRSVFGGNGAFLNIEQAGLSLHGALHYGPFTALRSDIMGPFRLFAGMQCSHGVISMGHSLEGRVKLNDKLIDFTHGIGYIETDRGRSFPSRYLWTQCVWGAPGQGSLMLAIASIPLPAGGFTGCICSVFYKGRQYRLATYQGARVGDWSCRGAAIRQGRYRLEAELLRERKQPLRAPVEGRMERTIHESLCATVCYRFWRGEELLFRHTDENASFEYSAKA